MVAFHWAYWDGSIIWADVDCFHSHPNKNRTSNPTEIVTLDFYEFLFLGGVPVLSYYIKHTTSENFREVLYPCRSHVALLFACLSHPPSAGHRMSCPRSGATVSGTKVGTTLGAAGGLPAGRNGSCFHQKSKYHCTTRTLGTIWKCFFQCLLIKHG